MKKLLVLAIALGVVGYALASEEGASKNFRSVLNGLNHKVSLGERLHQRDVENLNLAVGPWMKAVELILGIENFTMDDARVLSELFDSMFTYDDVLKKLSSDNYVIIVGLGDSIKDKFERFAEEEKAARVLQKAIRSKLAARKVAAASAAAPVEVAPAAPVAARVLSAADQVNLANYRKQLASASASGRPLVQAKIDKLLAKYA